VRPGPLTAATPIWLASARETAAMTGYYVQKRKRERPAVATDPVNQQRALASLNALIHNASGANRTREHEAR